MNKLARTYRIDYARLRTAAEPHTLWLEMARSGYICAVRVTVCVCMNM